VRRGLPVRPTPGTALAVGLLQHADQHRPERSVLLAIDQQLGEGAGSPFLRCRERVLRGSRQHRRNARLAPSQVGFLHWWT
jgi:hypothetical protein